MYSSQQPMWIKIVFPILHLGKQRLREVKPFPRVSQPGLKPRNPEFKARALPAELSPPLRTSWETLKIYLLTKYVRKFDWFCRSFSTPHKNTNSIRQVCPLLTLLLLTVMVATSQEGLNKSLLHQQMNERPKWISSGTRLLAPVFLRSFPITPLPPLPHSLTAPYCRACFRFFVGPEVRGTGVWIHRTTC